VVFIKMSCCPVYNCPEWIEKNKADFAPPVCNKCMFSDQLKVFYVGGPNERKDYHLEEGEEIFYQVEGDMVLKVVENGKPKDIPIKQGELFLLPARIEHSPQRFAGTVGCVIERTRKPNEFDCLRYFTNEGNKNILWERWFHLEDVVKDLPPLIKEFMGSQEHQSGKPSANSRIREAPFEPQKGEMARPIALSDYIDKHLEDINKAPHTLYGAPKYRSEVLLYGTGKHHINTKDGELIVMPQRGKTRMLCCGQDETMGAFYMSRVPPNTDITLEVEGVCVTVRMI
jgi:3-hydroxyanthranilate 3,4-dioxygenase